MVGNVSGLSESLNLYQDYLNSGKIQKDTFSQLSKLVGGDGTSINQNELKQYLTGANGDLEDLFSKMYKNFKSIASNGKFINSDDFTTALKSGLFTQEPVDADGLTKSALNSSQEYGIDGNIVKKEDLESFLENDKVDTEEQKQNIKKLMNTFAEFENKNELIQNINNVTSTVETSNTRDDSGAQGYAVSIANKLSSDLPTVSISTLNLDEVTPAKVKTLADFIV